IRSVFLDYMEKHGLARMNELMFGKANNPTMRKRAEVRFKRFLEGKPYAVGRHRITMNWACTMGFKLGIPLEMMLVYGFGERTDVGAALNFQSARGFSPVGVA